MLNMEKKKLLLDLGWNALFQETKVLFRVSLETGNIDL